MWILRSVPLKTDPVPDPALFVSRNQGFPAFLCLLMEGAGSVKKLRIRIQIQEAQNHVDPPDPEHWFGFPFSHRHFFGKQFGNSLATPKSETFRNPSVQ
jgi:hypothetical protein